MVIRDELLLAHSDRRSRESSWFKNDTFSVRFFFFLAMDIALMFIVEWNGETREERVELETWKLD